MSDITKEIPLAFPNSVQPDFQYAEPGMDLRDYFAAKALQGFIAQGPHDCDEHGICHDAYLYADAMLKARKAKS